MNDDWWSLPFGFLIFTSIHYPLLKVAHPFLVDLTLSQDILSLSLSLSPVFGILFGNIQDIPVLVRGTWFGTHFFCDVRYGLWFLSSNEFWYRNSQDAQWLDGQYLHTFVSLSENWLVVQKQFIQLPDISKASFFYPLFLVLLWCIYIYIGHVMVTGVCPGLDILQV